MRVNRRTMVVKRGRVDDAAALLKEVEQLNRRAWGPRARIASTLAPGIMLLGRWSGKALLTTSGSGPSGLQESLRTGGSGGVT